MSALKSHDLISLQSTIFLEESTDSFSAHRPISTASKYSKKRGGSAFIKRKTLNSQKVLWEELRTLKRKIYWYQTETNHFYLKEKNPNTQHFFCHAQIVLWQHHVSQWCRLCSTCSQRVKVWIKSESFCSNIYISFSKHLLPFALLSLTKRSRFFHNK